MRAVGPNHVGITAHDLDTSRAFYVEVFGLEPLPSFTFATPVAWLRLGDVQLHLIRSDDAAPRSHHLALEVDDFTAAYRTATARGIRVRDVPLFSRVCELPDGGAQMFVRDPAGNLLEITHRDAGTIDRTQVPDLVRLADLEPQTSTGRPSLFLDPGRPAAADAAAGTIHRSPAEVFAHHGRALLAGDLDDLVADYAADAVVRRPGAVHRGRDQVRAFFAGLLAELPAARWEAVSTAIDGEVVFHEWTATSARHHVPDGIDTLVVRDGLIRVQTVRYTLLPAR